jgi:multidrug efflux pump subunit AcrB
MFKFALEKPIILTIGLLILCLFGLLAVFRVPVQMTPDVDTRVISVVTNWPGATPQDVEQELIIEQEEYLRNVTGIERMISTASTGSAEIELEFSHDTDINELLIRVNNALSQVPAYPENVDEPRILTNSASEAGFIYLQVTPLQGNPQGIVIEQMLDFLEDNVATRLERIQGVSRVSVMGGAQRQIKVYIDPVKLAERQISLIQVRNAIRSRNRDVSGGDIDSGKRRYLVRTIGRFDALDSIEDLVLSEQNGTFVRLRDVGYVEHGSFEIRRYAYFNGEPALTLVIHKQIGSNVVETFDNVMIRIEALKKSVLEPEGMTVTLSSDDVRYVKSAITNVYRNLLIGACLAIITLFLFLRSVSATLIGAIGIPICTIAAFLGILITGRTINVISLAGVAFSIGMTLDNSIVVLENIYRYLAEGKTRWQAALDGVKEVWPAVLASTLTTVFVFLPVLFVREEAGQLYSDIAIAVSASILMSMIVAISLVPAACSRYLQPARYEEMKSSFLQRMGAAFSATVMRFLIWCLSATRRSAALVSLVLLLSLSIIFGLTPPAEYLPEGEEQKIFTQIAAPSGYNIEESHAIIRELSESFLPYVGQDPDLYASGRSEVPALTSALGFGGAGDIMFLTEVIAGDQVDDMIDILTYKTGSIPGMFSFATRGSIFSSNSGGTRSINIDITGSDLAGVFNAGFMSFNRARTIFQNAQIRQEPPNLSMGQPLVEIHPDWERAAELGINADELGYSLWAYADGAFVDEFFIGDDKIDMFLYSTHESIKNIEDINHIMLYSSRGGVIPLSAFANVIETVNTEIIRRVDSERAVTLSIVPPKSIPLETGVQRVQSELIDYLLNSGQLSDDIKMRITGASDLMKATRQALSGNFIIAIIISYLLMVAIFSHWGYPFIIMMTVPIGISGGIVGLWLLNLFGGNLDIIGLQSFQQSFDMITMLGFLILIGTVVNNPILIVERTKTNIQKHGMDATRAIIESTRTRLRPIMISSITTVFGLSPLVFFPGAGTELYRGLGAIVLFGILFTSIITLTFLPCLLSLMLHATERGRPRLWQCA